MNSPTPRPIQKARFNPNGFGKPILWLLLCLTAATASGNSALIAQVDRGIVPQTRVQSGWLPVRLLFAYQGTTYTVRLQVNSEEYNRYTQKMGNRPRPSDLVARLELAQQGAKDIAPLILAIRRAAPSQQPETLAAFALSLVQSLPYKLDALTTPFDDAWRAPLQTLVDREIDCEDSSILYSSLLSGLGINNGLVIVPGHMLTAVEGDFDGDYLRHQGNKYYVAETTGLTWTIGQTPPQHQGATARILPVSAIEATSPIPSNHPLTTDETSLPESPSLAPSSSTFLWLLIMFIFGTSLLLLWVWLKEQKPLGSHAAQNDGYDDGFDDDPYKDYD